MKVKREAESSVACAISISCDSQTRITVPVKAHRWRSQFYNWKGFQYFIDGNADITYELAIFILHAHFRQLCFLKCKLSYVGWMKMSALCKWEPLRAQLAWEINEGTRRYILTWITKKMNAYHGLDLYLLSRLSGERLCFKSSSENTEILLILSHTWKHAVIRWCSFILYKHMGKASTKFIHVIQWV